MYIPLDILYKYVEERRIKQMWRQMGMRADRGFAPRRILDAHRLQRRYVHQENPHVFHALSTTTISVFRKKYEEEICADRDFCTNYRYTIPCYLHLKSLFRLFILLIDHVFRSTFTFIIIIDDVMANNKRIEQT